VIRVKACVYPGGSFKSIEISGHAKFEEKGKDIVCAGASALVETALLGLRHVALLECEVVKKAGYVYILIPEDAPIDKLEKANIILETIYLGLEDISKTYPKNMRTQRKQEV